MKSIESIRANVMAVLFCLFVGSPLILSLLTALIPYLNEILIWDENAEQFRNEAEVEDETELAELRWEDETLQTYVDAYIENRVPFKSDAVALAANAERQFIRLSNGLCRWGAYPTFYGSEYVYVPSMEALAAIPDYESDAIRVGIERFAMTVNELAAHYPDKRFMIYLTDYSYTARSNPTATLVSDFIDTEECAYVFSLYCTAPNVTLLYDSFDNIHNFYTYYYTSDHHWNDRGTLRAYNRIASTWGFETLENATYKRADGPDFVGSFARSGLVYVSDPPDYVDLDQSAIRLEFGDYRESGADHDAYELAPWPAKRWEFYGLFYEYCPSLYNDDPRMFGRKGLLISDSYGYSLGRILVHNYEYLGHSRALRAADIGSTGFLPWLEDTEASDIYFVGHARNFSTFLERNPWFFAGV